MNWKIKILVGALLLSGCHHNLKESDPKKCCTRLNLQTKEMDKFARYCKVAVFLKRGSISDPKVINAATQAVNICKFVFMVDKDHNLLSYFEDQHEWYRVQQSLPTNNLWWRHPTDCKPSDINCEEF